MDPIAKLSEYFLKFPGIGTRQAKRFAYFIASSGSAYAKEIAELIISAEKNMTRCAECFHLFNSSGKKSAICEICQNIATDRSTIMVVEKEADFESVRRTRLYSGKFFILGSLLPIIDKEAVKKARLSELLLAVERELKSGLLKEIILALPANPHGEHTDSYIRERLSKYTGLKISTLGRGFSTGTELEYSDSDTLKNALKNRG